MIHFKIHFLFNIFALISAIEYKVPATTRLSGERKTGDCDQDWRPCTCNYDYSIGEGGRIGITCEQTSVIDVIEVFDRIETSKVMNFDLLDFTHDEVGIPDSLLGNTYVEQTMTVNCGEIFPLYISENAFHPAKKTFKQFQLSGCNFSNSSLSFLEGSDSVKLISLDSNSGMGHAFSSFPSRLPKLGALTFYGGIGWDTLMISPKPLEAELFTKFYVTDSVDMTDEAMNIIMNWATVSFNSTLESLYISSNNLTKIPRQIESFGRLGIVELRGNDFSIVQSRSLVMKADEVFLVTLSNCNIYEIQPDAFQGNFKKTLIELQGNNLTRFESSVFQKILQNGGTIDVKGNPFNCEDDPCHLAWLFNENMTNLVKNAQCSNGTAFKDLDLPFFSDCKLFITTTESSLSSEMPTQGITRNPISSTYSFIGSISWSSVGEPSSTSITGGNVATLQTTKSFYDLSTYFKTQTNQDTSALDVSSTSSLPLSPTNYAPGIHPLTISPISVLFICIYIILF